MELIDGGGGSVAGSAAIRFWYNSSTNSSDYDNIQDAAAAAGAAIQPEHYMLFSDDIDQYFKKINLSNTSDFTNTLLYTDQNHPSLNCTFFLGNNSTTNSSSSSSPLCTIQQYPDDDIYHNYWALLLVLFPILTLFGNVLVILSVYRERTLQTATNYFIVSLALADLLVAVVVMPFAVYVLVNGTWALPSVVCDFYIAMDVTCSTSSIFNLVAISIDRYIAVTQPIKYAKHKNNRRIWMTIVLVWVISAAIGSPIVLGLNNTPDRIPDACLFFNSDFILFSSLSSFYIPCIIMVFLYYNIFKALRKRALAQKASRKPLPSEIKAGSVIENLANTKRLAETHLGPTPVEEQATNTGSGSADEDDDIVDAAECQVISNDKSTEFILATVVEEAAVIRRKDSKVYDKIISSVVASLATPNNLVGDPNGNNDSGYAHSQPDSIAPESPRPLGTTSGSGGSSTNRASGRKNGATIDTEMRTVATITTRTASIRSISGGSKKDQKRASTTGTTTTTTTTAASAAAAAAGAARFTIYKVNKASRKKREKSSAKKERKATKTLAIVLGVFLICWVPFFTCNVLDAMCSKLNFPCNPGVSAFLLTTWLGYMNSFVNPVIYTIFNPEFRKAFKKIMCLGP